jgi:RNA polymerase primary sigma factor
MTKQISSFYTNNLKSMPLLTRKEEADLAAKIHNGDRAALEKLVASNMRFVISEAYKLRNCGLPVEDLICEGNMALFESAKKFYADRNAKFITYAAANLKWTFSRAIAENRLIHIPLNKIKDASLFPAANVSLDATISSSSDDDDRCLGSFFADESIVDPSEELEAKELCSDVANLIDSALDKRTAIMVRMHYGLGGYEAISNADIGRYFGVGRENVRQILVRAEQKMRLYSENNNLQFAA